MEVYNPLTNKTCQLPDLPDVRVHHSLCGGLLCGGGDVGDDFSRRSCLLLDPRTGRFDCTLAWLVKGSHKSRKRIYFEYHLHFDPPTNSIIFLIVRKCLENNICLDSSWNDHSFYIFLL